MQMPRIHQSMSIYKYLKGQYHEIISFYLLYKTPFEQIWFHEDILQQSSTNVSLQSMPTLKYNSSSKVYTLGSILKLFLLNVYKHINRKFFIQLLLKFLFSFAIIYLCQAHVVNDCTIIVSAQSMNMQSSKFQQIFLNLCNLNNFNLFTIGKVFGPNKRDQKSWDSVPLI